MPHKSAFDADFLDAMLKGARTPESLLDKAQLFRHAAALCWDASIRASQAMDDAIERGIASNETELGALVDRLNPDWRLVLIAVYLEAVALELTLKRLVAIRSGYDAAEAFGHRLFDLLDQSEAATVMELDDNEERLLWNLQQALDWQGRYPTPKPKQIAKAVHRRPSHIAGKSSMAGELHHADRALIDGLFRKLQG